MARITHRHVFTKYTTVQEGAGSWLWVDCRESPLRGRLALNSDSLKEIPRNRIYFMVSTREPSEMGRIPVSPSGLESADLECVADPSISRPNGAMHPSEGCKPGKGIALEWVGTPGTGCVLKERRIRMNRTCGRHLPIGGIPSERVDVSGVVPKVPPWAGMRRPVGACEPYRLAALRCNGTSSHSQGSPAADQPWAK